MKILHVINNLGSGGAEKLIETIVPIMRKMARVTVDVLILTDENNVFSSSLEKNGIRIIVVKYRSIYDLRNIIEIKKYILEGNYDVIHSHTFPTQIWVSASRLFLSNKNIKFVTTEHSTHNRRRNNYLFKLLDAFLYSQYDYIVSISEQTEINLKEWLNPKENQREKFLVIENGVDLERISTATPYEKEMLIKGMDGNAKLVCMIGRFSEAKNHRSLILAMKRTLSDVHLVLVGEGPLKSENIKLSNQNGLNNRIHFLGFRQDVAQILKTVDIVVLSSNWEGFGLAAIEGMAAGKPVLVSNVPGLSKIVDQPNYLFDNNDFDEIANKINRLFCNSDEYEKAVNYSLSRCQRFDILRTAKEYLSLYNRIV